MLTPQAREDHNPRVVYEMLYAGLPVFPSDQASTPEQLNRQPFVTMSEFVQPGESPDTMKANFRRFLAMATQPWVREHIERFLDEEMQLGRVYGELCIKMGICTDEVAKIRAPN